MVTSDFLLGPQLWPNRQNCCTVQPWTCELGYGADTMFHRTYFLFSTKTDVAKHESVTQKHLKSAPRRTHTVNVHGRPMLFSLSRIQHTIDKITALLLLGVKYNK